MRHTNVVRKKENICVHAVYGTKGKRSIRARPRVSYVEQFPDDLSDLTAEDESKSDVYVSPATDEESLANLLEPARACLT